MQIEGGRFRGRFRGGRFREPFVISLPLLMLPSSLPHMQPTSICSLAAKSKQNVDQLPLYLAPDRISSHTEAQDFVLDEHCVNEGAPSFAWLLSIKPEGLQQKQPCQELGKWLGLLPYLCM